MSSSEYWTEKRVTWTGVKAGLAIWVFALGALLLAEASVYVTATAAKADDFEVLRAEPAITDMQTGREYHLPNCLYCELEMPW